MKKLLKSLLLSLCFVFAATPLMAAMPFTDVKTSDWFHDEVQFAYDNDLFQGTSATTFSPQTGMTRAMFVTVLGRMSNVDITQYTDVAFADVVPGSWYAPYVQWAYQEGITNGISKTEFGVNNPVTREQLAKFIIEYAQYANSDFIQVSPGYDFDDDGDISGWASYYVSRCQEYGLLSGKGNNKFAPKDGSSRAEVATLIQRFCKAASGEKIIINYPYTNIPTYDSVTLDFCEMSGYFYGSYVQTSYFAGADLMVYEYNPMNVKSYLDYLTAAGFSLTRSEVVDGDMTYLYTKGNDTLIVMEPTVDGDKYLSIYIDIYSGDL